MYFVPCFETAFFLKKEKHECKFTAKENIEALGKY